jgi:hypothetical protein
VRSRVWSLESRAEDSDGRRAALSLNRDLVEDSGEDALWCRGLFNGEDNLPAREHGESAVAEFSSATLSKSSLA